jgi:hypothetical protein
MNLSLPQYKRLDQYKSSCHAALELNYYKIKPNKTGEKYTDMSMLNRLRYEIQSNPIKSLTRSDLNSNSTSINYQQQQL